MLSRRQFMRGMAIAGAAAAVPPFVESFMSEAMAAGRGPLAGTGVSSGPGYYFTAAEWSAAAALASRIVPTGTDPATDPGATEARAVVFIDRFLSAFELPAAVADNPAIWVRGRFSGRNPFPTAAGTPSSAYPGDDFLTVDGQGSGQGHFLALTPVQEISWRFQLYGTSALATLGPRAQPWAKQFASTLQAPTGLRDAYRAGLAAFDAYSQSLFGVPYASASTQEQDVMLAVAGNIVLGSVPLPVPSPPAAPAAASALVPIISLHTHQAVYGIPEYTWRNQTDDPSVVRLQGTAEWRTIGYDGDTQPLGNSVFDPNLYGPGAGPNAGFGADPGSADARAGVFVPFGGYREFRAVSTLDGKGTVIGANEKATIDKALAAGPGGGSK